MNTKTLQVLEYGKIIDMLQEEAGSELTRARIAELSPMTDPYDIRDGLDETGEAVQLITMKGPLPVGNFYDISGSLNMAKKGGTLTMAELLRIMYNLTAARNVAQFLKNDVPEIPLIQSMGEVIGVFRGLEDEIDRCILSEDEMSDTASPELRDIRRKIAQKNEAIKVRMDHLVNSQQTRAYLQDAIVTMRDGRYVVPVKAECKGQIPGIVHDQSASGQTLFIEPQAVVVLNNDLRQLEVDEQTEITRILQELSSRVAEHYAGIMNNQELLVKLDFINAKGRLALRMGAEKPTISTGLPGSAAGNGSAAGSSSAGSSGVLQLSKARHPLIDPKKVVPIDITIGQKEDDPAGSGWNALIITGPNTGGKTVTLKTCGLLAMMAQTGLHIPAMEGSLVPIYEDIFADIGDEQSIEQSLSTFSSHMTNIVHICEEARPGTLVLVDELGAGTDPLEGAALAISILEDLIDKGAQVLATTHYTELKKYALTKPGVQNASMQFDVETLSPTYKLIVGIPGRSNAFEISKKLGLAPELIDKARTLMESGEMEFEDVIGAIEADRKAAEAERDEATLLNVEMKKLREEAAAERKRIDKERDRILNEARAEARAMVEEAEDFSQDIREELKELAKLESMGERTRKFDNSRRKIKDAAGRYKDKYTKEINDNPVRIEDVKVGDWVKVVSMQQNGEVQSLPDNKGDLTVKIGNLKVKVKAEDLMILPDGRAKKKAASLDNAKKNRSQYGSLYRSKSQSVSVQTDVRGQQAEEALDHVTKYIDDAFMAGLKEVTIVHGRGEGILMKVIRDELKRNKHVKSFRRGGYNEGGDGVTIVVLK